MEPILFVMVTNMALAKSLLLTNDRFSSQFIFPKLNLEKKNILPVTEVVDKEESLFKRPNVCAFEPRK